MDGDVLLNIESDVLFWLLLLEKGLRNESPVFFSSLDWIISSARDCSNVSRNCWFSSSSLDITRFKLAMKHFFRSRVILACILFRSRLKRKETEQTTTKARNEIYNGQWTAREDNIHLPQCLQLGFSQLLPLPLLVNIHARLPVDLRFSFITRATN